MQRKSYEWALEKMRDVYEKVAGEEVGRLGTIPAKIITEMRGADFIVFRIN